MNNTIFSFLIILFAYTFSLAQVGIGTTTPEGVLDISSSTSGLIPPRVALTSTIVEAPVLNPKGGSLINSTLVWNTNTAGIGPTAVTPGMYYWYQKKWARFSDGSSTCSAGNFWLPNISPSKSLALRINSTKDVLIRGQYFVPGSILTIPDANITLNSFSIDTPTQITANITAGDLIQKQDVVVTNPCMSTTLTDGLITYNFIDTNHLIIDGNDVKYMTYKDGVLTKVGNANDNGWPNGTIYSIAPAIIKKGIAGGFSFKVDASAVQKSWAVGIDHQGTDEPNLGYIHIDFMFFSRYRANDFRLLENYTTTNGQYYPYAAGDVLEVKVSIAGEVTYWQNGKLLYTSRRTIRSDMNVLIDIDYIGTSLSELRID